MLEFLKKNLNSRQKIFVNITLFCAIITSIILFFYIMQRSKLHAQAEITIYYYVISSFTLIFVSILILSLRYGEEVAINCLLVIVSLIISIYIVDIVLTFYTPNNKKAEIAKKMGLKFDGRSPLEFVEQLRKEGVSAYPLAAPINLIQDMDYKADILPLGTISNKTTVVCNETGENLVYITDKHGFNNPQGIWSEKTIDILMIGDSFAQGECVQPSNNIAGVLTKKGYKVINLGAGGNGMLCELAGLTEYGNHIKPKIVFWIYFEGNDLSDLAAERQEPMLMKYLEGNFTQNLIDKQSDIDSILEGYLEKKIKLGLEDRKKSEFSRFIKKINYDTFKNIIKLNTLRDWFRPLPYPDPDELFIKILTNAKIRVSSWGGELYFVYLPAWERYTFNRNTRFGNADYHNRIQMLSMVKDLNIKTIDITDVFNSNPDTLSLFAYRHIGAHYNPKGYKLIGETLIKDLQPEGNLSK